MVVITERIRGLSGKLILAIVICPKVGLTILNSLSNILGRHHAPSSNIIRQSPQAKFGPKIHAWVTDRVRLQSKILVQLVQTLSVA